MLSKEDLKGKFGSYKWVDTEDNTQTLWSEYFDENCHSLAGAKAETVYNFIEGCEFYSKIEKGNVNILEVGLGVGVGLEATLESWLNFLKNNPRTQRDVNFYTLEIDPYLANLYLENAKYNFEVKETFLDEFPILEFVYKFQESQFKCFIIIGDARKSVRELKKILKSPLDMIYQDAFSPKKNPTLWTLQWFIDLKNLSEHSVILSTYSASQRALKALVEAGWYVNKRKGFGAKRSCTQAFADETKADKNLQNSLKSSRTIPYDDNEL